MSSAVRTIQTPFDSLKRSSTPIPKSAGKPTLHCCGGSFSTFGNIKRPVAASAAADAAENAPHAIPSQMRLVTSGELSSGSRELIFAAVAAAVVVFPARSTAGTAGLGATGATGLGATGAAATGAAGATGALGATGLSAVAPPGAEVDALGATGSKGAGGTGGFVSSAIIRSPFTVDGSPLKILQGFDGGLPHLDALVVGAESFHLVRQRRFLQ